MLTPPPPKLNPNKLTLLSSVIGSLIENYDFAIYGFFATTLISLFFPDKNPAMNLLLAYAIFSIGYIIRPFGGIIFGYLGDVLGRKAGLLSSIICMGIPLFLMSILPSYASIGITAAFLLIACRMFQGLSVGGEFPSALVFLAEHATTRNRGLISSMAFCGINMGLLMASAMSAILSHLLSPNQLYHWAWRIAFAYGALLAIAGFFIRRRLRETPVFLLERAQNKPLTFPLLYTLKNEPFNLMRAVGITSVFATAIPIILIFMPAYLSHYLTLSAKEALSLNTWNAFIFIFLIPLMGYLSDRLGRKLILLTG